MTRCLFAFGILFWFSLIINPLRAQKPIEEVEVQLKSLAYDLLYHESFELKLALNKEFASLLSQTLRRPESYAYPWDSLQSISILEAEDQSFKIFTWQIMDQKSAELRYGPAVHYYFGFIQRKYLSKQGKTHYLVIPLIEMPEIPRGVENMVLDHTQWLGGLYYPHKYQQNKIPKYTFKYPDPSQPKSNGTFKQVKQDMYVLLGWNGLDNRSNLKFVDVLSFDPRDSSKAVFGANVFYFDQLVPKYRALFRYSEYAPFTLNYSFVEAGLFPWSRKKMIVYDHLGTPKLGDQKLQEIWEMGPDGSYDALEYKRGGRFVWKKNVAVAERLTRKQLRESGENQEKILRARLAELKRWASLSGDMELVKEIEQIEKRKDLDRQATKFIRKKEKLILERQREMEEREKKKMEESGIDLSGNS